MDGGVDCDGAVVGVSIVKLAVEGGVGVPYDALVVPDHSLLVVGAFSGEGGGGGADAVSAGG